MDTIQIQINALNGKVDSLHQIIEQLGTNVAQALTELNPGMSRSTFGTTGRYSYSHRISDASLEHKDVLSDHPNPDSTAQSGEKMLSAEVQIQRLTAQLTAAYNRIAALEEQLLAQRIH